MDAADKVYPDSIAREKNLIASLNTLQDMRLESLRTSKDDFNHVHTPKDITPATVLCISFVEPSFKHLAIAEYNMKVSRNFCDWGIMHVGEDHLNVINSLEKSAETNNVTLQFVEPSLKVEEILKKFSTDEDYKTITESLGPKFVCKGIPKSFLLMQIIPYAKKYNYVWLLDSDITFEEFEIEKYFSTMRNLPQSPLLLQPVVGTNDRPHTRLNSKYYDNKQSPSHIAPSNIIEIMLPMIDSGFLIWFAEFFMRPMMGIAYAVSGDFGSDLIWCRASALYLEIGLDVKDYRTRANAACIVITHTPIQHLDWDEVPISTKDDSRRLTAMYMHLLDGVKELRYRFLPTKNEGKIDKKGGDDTSSPIGGGTATLKFSKSRVRISADRDSSSSATSYIKDIISTKLEDKALKKSKQEIWREQHPDHPASIAAKKLKGQSFVPKELAAPTPRQFYDKLVAENKEDPLPPDDVEEDPANPLPQRPEI